jgi:hypothetical protein
VQHERVCILAELRDDKGARCAISPGMKATSRESRSSLATITGHLAVPTARAKKAETRRLKHDAEGGSSSPRLNPRNATKGPVGAPGDGWLTYRPRGVEMRFVVVADEDETFSFTAPWGETMVARPGDAIVQDLNNAGDTYRIAKAAFVCTYEVTSNPHSE